METNKRTYSHYTVEEKFQFIDDYYESKLSITQFCKNQKLNKSSFYKWLRQYEEAVGAPSRDVQGNFINISNDLRNSMNNLPTTTKTNIVASPGVLQASNSIVESSVIEPSIQKDEILLTIGKISIKCNYSILDKVMEKLQW